MTTNVWSGSVRSDRQSPLCSIESLTSISDNDEDLQREFESMGIDKILRLR